VTVLETVVTALAALAAGAVLIRGADGRSPAALGIALSRHAARHVGIGFAIGAAGLAVAALALLLTGALAYRPQDGTAVAWVTTVAAQAGMFWVAAFSGIPLRCVDQRIDHVRDKDRVAQVRAVADEDETSPPDRADQTGGPPAARSVHPRRSQHAQVKAKPVGGFLDRHLTLELGALVRIRRATWSVFSSRWMLDMPEYADRADVDKTAHAACMARGCQRYRRVTVHRAVLLLACPDLQVDARQVEHGPDPAQFIDEPPGIPKVRLDEANAVDGQRSRTCVHIDGDDLVTHGRKPAAEVRADEAGGTSNQ
jgi:hypothetical protein